MPRVMVAQEHQEDPLWGVSGEHAPELSSALAHYSSVVYEKSVLSLREFEAARIRTAQINGCMICQRWRTARDLAATEGVVASGPLPDEAFYAAIEGWREATAFSERERIAIEFADRMGQAPRSFHDDEQFWERVHESFSETEVVDLTLSIASWIAAGRAAHVLELDGFCPASFDQPLPV